MICLGVNSIYKLEWQTIILAIALPALPRQGDALLFKPLTALNATSELSK